MISVHSTAVVEDGAELGEGVQVGPYCLIGPRAKLAENVKLTSHVVIAGNTTIGPNTTIYPFSSLGHPPQHTAHKGEDTKLVIGRQNLIREGVTMNPGTVGGGGLTQVGDHCMFMTGSHVAHDCIVGNNIIFTNGAAIGGHVHVEDHVIIGGFAAVHQRSRLGRHAFIGGMSGVEGDVIPYGSVIGNRAYLGGLNIVGLKRRGFSRDAIHTLRNAYRLLFAQEGTFAERLADVEELFTDSKEVMEIVTFVRAESAARSLVMPDRDD